MNITWKDIAVGACVIVVGVTAYVFIGLDKRVDDQRKEIEQLSKQFAILVSVISIKMPSANIPALISTAAKNNVSPEDVSSVVTLLGSEPAQAKVYLKSQLHFNSEEVDSIMTPVSVKKIRRLSNHKESDSLVK